MGDDQNKESKWHPTVVAALIGAIATVVATSLTVFVSSRNTVENLQIEESPQASSTEKPAQGNDARTPAAASWAKATNLRGYYSADSVAGTYHLKINNNGSYVMSAPGVSGSIRGSVSVSGNYVVLASRRGQISHYVLGNDGSLTSPAGAGERLVFTKAK
jgi:hypothetical protein